METEPLSCCESCLATWRMVRDINDGLAKVANVMKEAGNNPMGKMFAKQMGIPLEALNGETVGR
jgi:hypothetical protein